MEYQKHEFDFIIDNVILPPKQPQEASEADWVGERRLLQLVLKVAVIFHGLRPLQNRQKCSYVICMLKAWMKFYDKGIIDQEALAGSIAGMVPGGMLALHVHAQNTGLLLNKIEDEIVFACFEASPTASSVLGAHGRLTRVFPARAFAVGSKTCGDAAFQKELATSLSQLQMERLEMAMPNSSKAGAKVIEERDTAHPKLVTEMLMNLLAAYGVPKESRCVSKHTRDEVSWSDAKLPWRRSPFWLCMRVAIQIALADADPMLSEHTEYKNFMLFVVIRISEKALARKSPTEKIHLINVKIARRVVKLGDRIFEFVLQAARSATADGSDYLQTDWHNTQRSLQTESPQLKTDSIAKDTELTLNSSKEILGVALDGHAGALDSTAFDPNCPSRIEVGQGGLPKALKVGQSSDGKIIGLADFEDWIANKLGAWVQSTSSSILHCQSLAQLIYDYESSAAKIYEGDPIQLSVMILTMLELWVALDRQATQLYPLLEDYSPEIPITFAEPLFLPRFNQMQRLRSIELYLSGRYQGSKNGIRSVFTDPHDLSFSTLFYNNSDELKDIREAIERDATENRSQKKNEVERKTAQYNRLTSEDRTLNHEYFESSRRRTVHDRACRKCKVAEEIRSLEIEIHEWPLPRAEAQAKAAVFELNGPLGFFEWRDATWKIVHDLGRRQTIKADNIEDKLYEYNDLSTWCPRQSPRITLVSKTKAFKRSHYRAVPLPASFGMVCKPCGLSFSLFDGIRSGWVVQQSEKPSIRAKCTYLLPDGPYRNLQYAVDSTTHSQNEVLANQNVCSADLSQHEFIAFASLRAGERIQWLNVLRELGSTDLNLDSEAVYYLLAQTTLQAGKPHTSNILRDSHVHFTERHFTKRLLWLLEKILSAIEANWTKQYTMSVLVSMLLRCSSLSSDTDVIEEALEQLRRVRQISLNWSRDLNLELHTRLDDAAEMKVQHRILHAALLCRETYAVDDDLRSRVMTGDNVEALVEASIHVHDNTPGNISELPLYLRQSLVKDEKLSHALENQLRTLILTNSKGINQAIRRVWDQASFENDWRCLPKSNERWVTNDTTAMLCTGSQSIHYNLLSSELLVNGRPLGRLPRHYTDSMLYQRIFGCRVLLVFAADIPGMLYMTARTIEGYQVYFGMKQGTLLILAKKDSDVFEVVPHIHFDGDLPDHYVTNCVHWLQLATSEVELRPRETLWQSSSKNWRIQFSRQGPSTMSLGRKKLVDIRSSTFQAVMNIMKPLETGGNIHVTCAEAGQLTIELPRYKIEFSLNSEGYLESPELGAIVDPDQSLDTWLGLESKLILRSFSNLTGLSKRSVVIPFGVASCHRVNNHVQVSIVPQSAAKIGYFRYQVDSALRRLNAPSDLRARLFKAYLHALTSHILPDPLTGRTGTEEALCCLREQSLRTCAVLSADVVDLLNRIAGLTPSRHFYPKHLRCMQQTKWKSKLSSLSQHDDFLVLAREIAAHSERFLILQEGTCGKFELKSRGDDFLLDRARLRHANFRSPLFGGNDGPPQGDTIYKGRDREIASAQGDRVFQVTSMIRDWPSNMKVPVNVSSMVLQWAAVAGYQRSFEWKSYSELLGSHFPDEWGALYNLCRRSGRDHDMYKLSFIFSGIAYRQSDCLDQIKVLLAFAFLPAFRHFKAPDFDNYALSVGMKPDESKIVGSIKRNWREYEARLHGTKVQYQSEATKQANAVRKHLMMNWPCNQPQMPNSSAVSLIDIAAISKEFKSHFHECYKNLRFSEHLGEVDNHLAAAQEGYLIKLPNAGDGLLPFVVGSSLDRIPIAPSLADLLQTQGPTLPRPVAKLTAKRVTVPSSCNSDNAELKSIVDQLCATTDPTRNRYANSLKSSLDALENASESKANSTLPLQLRQLVAYRTICESNLKNLLDAVRNSLVPATAVQQVVSDAGLWPRVTTAALLQLISSRSCVHIDPSWRRKILCLGEAITTTQRSERMLICAARDDILEFYKEAENVGHQDWPIEKYPDWLLIEIENNFLIRPIQARVACEMISPSSQENSVMQLNMGEGKSSVIIPMIITALADADQLVRVVVLKSLAKQMGYSLTQCLGGLVGRRLYQMPFSRKTPISIPMLDKLQTIYKECRLEQGVLLAQPEHILSFKLMGIERLSSAQSPIASTLMNIQEWLQRHCRDVLDESDELLAVHWQLIYTIGSQQHMDGQPDRWIMTQQIFSRIEKHASFLHEIDPDSVECEKRSSERFPALRILKPDLVGRLLDLLVSDIENGRLSGITLANCSQRQRDTALRFVKDQHISQPDHDFVITSFAEGSYLKPLLLLRGLIGFRIILFVLQSKRWLVNYGLDLTRCLMAVPYRAKGVPSPSAEFGHPDVAICLTCLSYYYTGLTETNLRDCFRLLFRMTDPTLEYHKWVSRCEALSPDLQTINSVNLEDDGLCRERLFPHLRFNKAVVDFYLANFVFPKEAKEFPEKLSSSGWDIPSESKHLPTTGFSGTNDNQYLLPLSMVQHDLDELKHTTAMVLGYILRPENREYAFTRDGRGQKLQLLDLLDLLPKQSPRVTVLIDAGAQILEMGNQDVAIRWLELDPDAKAVVFLNQDDEKMIVDRDSNVEPLATSSFSDRMNECLIYLDEVHTRGTDLSIAVGTRAAVTLGPKLTKDKLV